MPEPIIQTQKLIIGYTRKRKAYPVQKALNLNVYQGELVCLIGPNGCGKSTLLRSLSGLQPTLAGEISIKNRPLGKQTLKEKAKLIALVLTDRIEVNNLTVFNLIAIGRNPYTNWLGDLAEEDKQRIQTAISQVHLEGYEHRFINELSDGERQRAMIAKALVQDTPVILLDEPTAHLDLPNRVEVMILLRTLAKETHKAVILSTHELDLALQASDKIWLMKPQEGISIGAPEDLILNGNLQAVFSNRTFYFDNSTGNFIMTPTASPRKIALRGNSTSEQFHWTKRALTRGGYQEKAEASCVIEIDDPNKQWLIHQNNETNVAHSLSQLLALLEKRG